MKKNDLIGQRFGALEVLADGGRNKKQNVLWLCRCECGNSSLVTAYDLRRGKAKSCGCRSNANWLVTHGMGRKGKKRSKIYSIWAAMVNRCTNPNDQQWRNYGGRGIYVCDEWRVFTNFFKSVGDIPYPTATLDRIDNFGGYEPSNVRWVTATEQSRNKRNNRWLTINGETLILTDWCLKINKSRQSVYYSTKKRNIPIEEVIKLWL